MNKNDVSAIQKELLAASKAILEKHGLDIKSFRVTYDESNFNLSMKSEKLQKSESVVATEEKIASMYLNREGLKLQDALKINGVDFIIVGYNSRKPKNAVELKRVSDGKSFNCPVQTAKNCLVK